ncbi:MAG: hypothetical protein ACOYT4_05290 [Nanoarchaeota archaeon]
MKREALLFFVILFIAITSAEPALNLNKQEFQPGETLIAEIKGDFAKQISLNDIQFYEGKKRIFFERDLTFYNNTHFFYAYLTKSGNFTIVISSILYKNPDLQSTTIEKQIEVKENFLDLNKTQTKIISVKPGFIFTSKIPELTLFNVGTQNLSISYESEKIDLMPGESQQISFSPKDSFSYMSIQTYDTFQVPVIYNPLTNNSINLSSNKSDSGLQLYQENLEIKIVSNQKSNVTFTVINNAEENASDVLLNSNLEILEFPKIKDIPAKSAFNVTADLFSENFGYFKGQIEIKYSINKTPKTLIVPIEVYSFPDEAKNQSLELSEKTCEELKGFICNESQKCHGNYTFSSGNFCCVGKCEERTDVTDSSKTRWLIGLMLLILLAIVILVSYKKYKKTGSLKPEESLKQSENNYQKRISGGLARS